MVKIKSIFKDKLIQSILIIASSTAGAQAITILFSPVITRLFSPESYGALGSFTALLMIVAPAAALTYPIAIVLPKEDDDAKTIARFSLHLAIAVTLLFSIFLFILDQIPSNLFAPPLIPGILIFSPLAVFFTAFHQIFYQWLIRKKEFKVLAKTSITQSLFLNLSKLAGGLSVPSGFSLILITTIGQGFHAFLLWISIKRKNHSLFKKPAIEPTQEKKPKALIVKYRDFPLYRAPQVIINAISESIPVLMLASFFGSSTVGHFTLSKSIIMASVSLVAKSVSDVFYPKISEIVAQGQDPSGFITKSCLTLLLISFLPALSIFFFGPEIFVFAFGKEWDEAGHYAKWITLWLLFFLAARPLIAAIPVLGLQRLLLFHEIFFLFFKVVAIFLAYKIFTSAQSTVIIYSLTSLFAYLALFLLVFVSLKNKKSQKVV